MMAAANILKKIAENPVVTAKGEVSHYLIMM